MKRRLTQGEAQLWARVAQTVVPLDPAAKLTSPPPTPPLKARGLPKAALPKSPSPSREGLGVGPVQRSTPPPRPISANTLDSTWDRRLARGLVAPDFTLDLHGHNLEAAHLRMDMGLAQAKALGARLVLLITGRPRPVDAADRANRRGAIRAKVLDWLAMGEHAHDIAAVRGAHRRHGGAGALYIVLKRRR